jgi:hypothetical protein
MYVTLTWDFTTKFVTAMYKSLSNYAHLGSLAIIICEYINIFMICGALIIVPNEKKMFSTYNFYSSRLGYEDTNTIRVINCMLRIMYY